MMSKVDIERIVDERLAEIRRHMIEELQGQVENEDNPKTIWDLKVEDRETYYRIYGDGDIDKLFFSADNDKQAREIGNAFLTFEEADFERERRKIETIMRKYSRPFKYREYNYYIKCNHDDGMLRINSYEVISSGEPYFETREIAQKVIDEIGEDKLKKYWFRIEDDK
ncbi:hypothetical protein [Peptostreptococcus sp.]